jgi:hypothetical protein
VSEESCPFCRATLDASFRASPAPRAPGARLTRAALFAFGTGTLALAPACSSTTSPDGTEFSNDAYGGPPIIEDDAGDAGPATGDDAGDATFLADAAYGAAPTDSGHD